jgi:phosphatidate cytidylyltransferase
MDPTGGPQQQGSARPAGRFQDIGPRVASGVVMAFGALGLVFIGGLPFVLLVTVAGALMCWEWGRIIRGPGFDAALVVHALAAAVATLLAGHGQLMLAALALLVGTIVVPALASRQHLLSAVGVAYVGVPAIALVALRADPAFGFAAVMLVLLVVASVDIAAFVGGRSIGGPRLWPAVSPNKTWAGLISGVGAGVVVGGLLASLVGAPIWRLALVSLLMGAAAQAGDLAESALKRSFGVKDSSQLIPGHGGILDRVDGIVAAATLAGIVGIVANIAVPARALLFGY